MEHRNNTNQLNEPAIAGTDPSQSNPPRKKRWNLLSAVFMVALIAVTITILFKDTSISEVWTAVQSADPLWLLAALGAALFASVLFGVALHIGLRALYHKPIPNLDAPPTPFACICAKWGKWNCSPAKTKSRLPKKSKMP